MFSTINLSTLVYDIYLSYIIMFCFLVYLIIIWFIVKCLFHCKIIFRSDLNNYLENWMEEVFLDKLFDQFYIYSYYIILCILLDHR